MAVQTLIGHYITEIRRRTSYRYESGYVTAFVPELPGIEAQGNSEDEAREAYLGIYLAWLLKQLDQGWPVPPLGEHDLNTDFNRQLFMRETGLDIPLLKEQPDPDQMWFWTPKWQQMEREADQDIAQGRVERFDSDEEFDAALRARRHMNADL
jgi:predicted RNase H-like HicB family nuclease